MTIRIIRDEVPNRQTYAFDGTIAVNLGDLMFHDVNDVKPVTSVTDQGSLAKNIAYLKPKFAGVAAETRTVLETNALTDFPVMTDVQCEIACVSNTFEKGDMVTFAAGTGNLTHVQKVDKTTDPALAIGYVTRRYASAVTTVEVRIISHNQAHAAGGLTVEIPVAVYPGAGTTRTLCTFRENLTIMSADVEVDVAQNITGTLVKAAINAAPASGTTPWCNAAAINFNTAANTNQSLTLTSTVADLNVIPGDKAALVFNAALNTGQALVTLRARRAS